MIYTIVCHKCRKVCFFFVVVFLHNSAAILFILPSISLASNITIRLRIQYAIIGEILFILQNHSHQINYFGTYIISKAQISTIIYKLRN